jgi:hypothetical protein
MKEQAIAKLQLERKSINRNDQKINAMGDPVADALIEFCRQDIEFAQAVVQGGSFAECMVTVAKGAGAALSDLEAYGRAVQYYFPGAGVNMTMTINLCASVEHDEPIEQQTKKPGIVLDLTDFL